MGITASAQTTSEAAVLLTPVFTDTGAARVSWTPSSDPSAAVIYGRLAADRTWVSSDTLPAPQSTWAVPVRTEPSETAITQSWTINGLTLFSTGYISSRVEMRAKDVVSARRVLLIIDELAVAQLASTIERFVDDLIRDGWVVDRGPVLPSWKPTDIKRNLILPAYRDTLRGPLTHVFIIGDVPYAMSGGYSVSFYIPNPDFHPEHGGAWAADAYYADVETSPGVDAEYQWTDFDVELNMPDAPSRPENVNIPYDGKFDQSLLPSDLELCVGRIDMRRLKAFGVSDVNRTREFELLRKYLYRDHSYRIRSFEPPMRALVEDNFGLFSYVDKGLHYTEAFASSGWRSFAPIVGAENIMVGDWIADTPRTRPALDSFPSLLAYGCGGGGYEHCTGLGDINDFVNTPLQATFTLLFGSYFGDVWSDDNLMRGALAADGWVLTCGWSGRPHWFLHSLADGSTIGECQRLSANNGGEYVGATVTDIETGEWQPYLLGNRFVNNLLLGDPTLTLQGPVILGELQIQESLDGTTLTWDASQQHDQSVPSKTVGYVVEASASLSNPFTFIDFVEPTASASITRKVSLAAHQKFVRVRPYFLPIQRLGPLPGRGLVGTRTTTSVAEGSKDDFGEYVWNIYNTLGQHITTITCHSSQISSFMATYSPITYNLSPTYSLPRVLIAVSTDGKAECITFSR